MSGIIEYVVVGFLGALVGGATLFGLLYAPAQAKLKEQEKRFKSYQAMRVEADRLNQELSVWPTHEQLSPPPKISVSTKSWLKSMTSSLSQWLESQRKKVIALRQAWDVSSLSYERWSAFPLPAPPEGLAALGDRLEGAKEFEKISYPERPELPACLDRVVTLPSSWDALRELLQESLKRIKRVGENTQNMAPLREYLMLWHQKLQILSFNLSLEANKMKSPAVLTVSQEMESLWQQLESWQQQFQENVDLLREDATAAGAVLEKTTQSLVTGYTASNDISKQVAAAKKEWLDGAGAWQENQGRFLKLRQMQSDLFRLLQQENVSLGDWYEKYQNYHKLLGEMKENHRNFGTLLQRLLGE